MCPVIQVSDDFHPFGEYVIGKIEGELRSVGYYSKAPLVSLVVFKRGDTF